MVVIGCTALWYRIKNSAVNFPLLQPGLRPKWPITWFNASIQNSLSILSHHLSLYIFKPSSCLPSPPTHIRALQVRSASSNKNYKMVRGLAVHFVYSGCSLMLRNQCKTWGSDESQNGMEPEQNQLGCEPTLKLLFTASTSYPTIAQCPPAQMFKMVYTLFLLNAHIYRSL